MSTPEIRFYHLQSQNVDQSLPALISKAYSTGSKIVIKVNDAQTSERLNEVLWTYHPNSFLPHGNEKDGNPAQQPIWITQNDENPNGASVLINVSEERTTYDPIDDITIQCEIFQGFNETELKAARARWQYYKEKDYTVTYWQQNERGGWDQKV